MELILLVASTSLLLYILVSELVILPRAMKYSEDLLKNYESVSMLYESTLTSLAKRTDLTKAEADGIASFLEYCSTNKYIFSRERLLQKELAKLTSRAHSIYKSCLKTDKPVTLTTKELDKLDKEIIIVPFGDFASMPKKIQEGDAPLYGWILNDRERVKCLSFELSKARVPHMIFNALHFDS